MSPLDLHAFVKNGIRAQKTIDMLTINIPTVIGVRVRAKVAFSGVPKGTEGVIDDVYNLNGHLGLMVAWDLPDQPLPDGYRVYDGRPAFVSHILRDGFGQDELKLLEVV
jgi:hypothetical protein